MSLILKCYLGMQIKMIDLDVLSYLSGDLIYHHWFVVTYHLRIWSICATILSTLCL